MPRLSDRALAKTATGGAFITVSMIFYYHFMMQQRVRSSQVYQDSMNILQQHTAARSFLGEPIKAKWIDLSDSGNICTPTSWQMQVPVRGPIQKGTLHIWASRILENPQDDKELREKPFNLDRLELGLEKERNKRLVVKK